MLNAVCLWLLFLWIVKSINPNNDRYPVFWNVDETNDPKVNLTAFEIISKNYTQCGNICSNQQNNCTSWKQGYWPIITSSWQLINGGVPQNGNLSLHLQTITETLPHWIPNINWSGNAVLDFEAWTTIWEYNDNPSATWHSSNYQNYSIQLVQKQHPDWNNQTQIINEAKSQFETAATEWFVETLKLCKSLRPNAKWGFYGLPQGMKHPCIHIMESNGDSYYLCGYSSPTDGPIFRNYSDKQIPIWQHSDIIYPSIYNSGQQNMSANIGYINNTLLEALRCAQNGKRMNKYGNDTYIPLVYPYMMQAYQNGSRMNWLSVNDLNISVVLPYNIGVHGLVIWGSTIYDNDTSYWDYTNNTSGPLIKNVVDTVNKCAEKNCNNHGRCTGLNNSSCQCDKGYSGISCNIFF